MKIILTELNRGYILTLPVTPQDFEWGKTRKVEILEALLQDVDITGNISLRTYQIQSFIPDSGSLQGKKYPFQITNSPGRNVVKSLDYWVDNDTALRMVVTAKDERTLENVIVKITEFKKKLDRVGDYVYTMVLTEHVPAYGT